MGTVESSPLGSLVAERTPVVNDFQIMIATVNGSGSQTANTVILRLMARTSSRRTSRACRPGSPSA